LAAVTLACLVVILLHPQQVVQAKPQPIQTASSQSVQASSTTLISSSRVSTSRIRPNRLRRPDFCRESLPKKSDDLPALVAIGRVKEVYLSNGNGNGEQASMQANSNATSQAAQSQVGADPQNNKALVRLERIIKGKRELLNTDIIVSGFNSSNPALTQCPNFVKPNDTLILLLNQLEAAKRYSIQGNNLLGMNLYNLDRINALAQDEIPKRRPPIEDILCEAHYCAYGRCKIVDAERGQVRCECPDFCPPLPAPVCGSDNTTYANECQLIKEGCRRQRPLFVTKESSC